MPFQHYTSYIQFPDDAGGDTVSGGSGDDFLIGSEGEDSLSGDDGQDDLIGGHSVRFGIDSGDNVIGGDGDDYLVGDNAEIVRTRISANSTFPWIVGAVWETYPCEFDTSVIRRVRLYDNIDGVEGNDALDGGEGNDVLYGGRGNDLLSGGPGDDEVSYASLYVSLMLLLTDPYTPSSIGFAVLTSHSLRSSLFQYIPTTPQLIGGLGSDEVRKESENGFSPLLLVTQPAQIAPI